MPLEKTSKTALVATQTLDAEFEAKGEKHKIVLWPLTWERKKRAEGAATEYYREGGKLMFRRNMTKYQMEFLKEMVKDSTIPNIPGVGWIQLDPDVGEAMFEAALEVLSPSEAEVQEAKNPSGAGPQSPPESSSPSESSGTPPQGS